MKIRKIMLIGGCTVAGIALAIAFLVVCPGSVDGIWTGPMISCLCDAHNFVVIEDGTCVLYFEDETNSPPQRTFYERSGANSWTWHYTELLPRENSEIGVRTNDFIITPHILHANVLNVSEGDTTRLYRDFRRGDVARVRALHADPQEIEFFRSKWEAILKRKEEIASNTFLHGIGEELAEP